MARLNRFSSDPARKVGRENAVHIYGLNEPMICHRPSTPAEQTMRANTSALDRHLAHGDTMGPCG